MSKKPTLSNLAKQAKKLDAKRQVTIQDFDFILDSHFRNTKLQKMLLDYFDIITSLQKRDLKLDSANMLIYLSLVMNGLVLKTFTNIPFDDDADDNVLAGTVNNLIDLDIFEQLWNSFEESELKKINDLFEKVGKNAPKMNEMVGDLFVKTGLNNGNGDFEFGESEDTEIDADELFEGEVSE